jgi:cytoskeleton-associated protein 5
MSCAIWSVNKLAAILVYVSTISKNLRSKSECLDELANMIEEYGVNIVVPKDAKGLAKFTGHGDTSVRNSAVRFFTEVYRYLGTERLWALIGRDIDAKSKDLLMQKFKKTSMHE